MYPATLPCLAAPPPVESPPPHPPLQVPWPGKPVDFSPIPAGHILGLTLISLPHWVQAEPRSWKPHSSAATKLPSKVEAALPSSVSFPGDTP